MVCLRGCVSLCVSLSVCLLVTFVGPAKTAEPITMSLETDSDGPKEPCIRRGSRAPRRRGNSWGSTAHSKALGSTFIAPSLHPIYMLYDVFPRKEVR